MRISIPITDEHRLVIEQRLEQPRGTSISYQSLESAEWKPVDAVFIPASQVQAVKDALK